MTDSDTTCTASETESVDGPEVVPVPGPYGGQRAVLLRGKKCREFREERAAVEAVRQLGAGDSPRHVKLTNAVLVLQEPAKPETPDTIREKLQILQELEERTRRGKATESLEIQIASLQKRFQHNNYEQMYLLFRGRMPVDQDPDAMIPVRLLQQEQRKTQHFKEQKKSLAEEVGRLEKTLSDLRKERDQLNSSLRISDDRLRSMDGEMRSLRDEVAQLSGEVAGLEVAYDEARKEAEVVPLLKEDNSCMRMELAEQQQEIQGLEAEIKQLTTQLKNMRESNQELREKEETAQVHAAQAREAAAAAQQRAREAEDALAENERALEVNLARAAADSAVQTEQRLRAEFNKVIEAHEAERANLISGKMVGKLRVLKNPPRSPGGTVVMGVAHGPSATIAARTLLDAAAIAREPLECMLMAREDRCAVRWQARQQRQCNARDEDTAELEQLREDYASVVKARDYQVQRATKLAVALKSSTFPAHMRAVKMAANLRDRMWMTGSYFCLWLFARVRKEQRSGEGVFSPTGAAWACVAAHSKACQTGPQVVVGDVHDMLWDFMVQLTEHFGAEPPLGVAKPPPADDPDHCDLNLLASACDALFGQFVRQLRSGLGSVHMQMGKAMRMMGTLRSGKGDVGSQRAMISFLQRQKGGMNFGQRSQLAAAARDLKARVLKDQQRNKDISVFHVDDQRRETLGGDEVVVHHDGQRIATGGEGEARQAIMKASGLNRGQSNPSNQFVGTIGSTASTASLASRAYPGGATTPHETSLSGTGPPRPAPRPAPRAPPQAAGGPIPVPPRKPGNPGYPSPPTRFPRQGAPQPGGQQSGPRPGAGRSYGHPAAASAAEAAGAARPPPPGRASPSPGFHRAPISHSPSPPPSTGYDPASMMGSVINPPVAGRVAGVHRPHPQSADPVRQSSRHAHSRQRSSTPPSRQGSRGRTPGTAEVDPSFGGLPAISLHGGGKVAGAAPDSTTFDDFFLPAL